MLESTHDDGPPISRTSAQRVAQWMRSNFGDKLDKAIEGTPFTANHLIAIVCQETAIYWVNWIDKQDVKTIVERAVFDASGDYPGTSRSVFPRDTTAFRSRLGKEFTDMLIAEANQMRALRGFKPTPWVYKGYGLFQYDLQYVLTDESFFREKQWYDFDICLAKAMGELKTKYAATHDVRQAIQAYNGSGPKAEQYASNVMQFLDWCTSPAVA